MSAPELTVRIAPSVGSFDRDAWNALGGNDNPFISHEFLTAMEDSGSVGPGTGWEPAPIVITDDAARLLAAMPSYAKGHSQGEYVFDHSWADAWHRAGGRYYPKLQIAAPFTPATGPRLLLSDDRLAPHLLRGVEAVCLQNGMSSAHATFIAPEQLPLLLDALRGADLVLGSRWVAGGGTENWPKSREILSKGGNLYTRAMLGVPIHDATGGYRAFRASTLRRLDLHTVASQGYCFQVDLAWRTVQRGMTVTEVPITFVERSLGASKMSRSIVAEALWRVTQWGAQERFRSLRRALGSSARRS